MSDEKKGPIEKLRDGNLSASIWENTHDDRRLLSVQFQRNYRGSDGQMRNASSFPHQDLLRLSKLAERSYDRRRELREELHQSQKPQERRTRRRDRDQEQER